MESFVIIVNGWKPLTIITKRSILDVAAVSASATIDFQLTYAYWSGVKIKHDVSMTSANCCGAFLLEKHGSYIRKNCLISYVVKVLESFLCGTSFFLKLPYKIFYLYWNKNSFKAFYGKFLISKNQSIYLQNLYQGTFIVILKSLV